MARQIDFSKPLNADEQAYVADRPWLVQNALLNGEEVVLDDDFIVDDDETDEERAEREAQEQWCGGIHICSNAEHDHQEPQGEPSEEEDESEEDESNEDPEEDETEEVAPYEEWDYAALKEEAGNRGLSKAGSAEQLIKRLVENDAESTDE